MVNFEQLDKAILECVWVPNKVLPERYHDNREGGSTLERVERIYNKEVAPVVNTDARNKSVVISDGVIQHGSTERIELLNKYRADVEAERDIEYDVNEDKLYRLNQTFVSAMELDLDEE